MKFLCGNCKAKYQIADEKITGRTLRMKCRRCSHDIVIRGESEAIEAPAQRPGAASAGSRRRAQAPAPAPQPRAGATSSRRQQPAGSALGADFRRQVSSGGHDVPERVSPLEQWHVAINDVPVGPVKRDEIARKVAAGAVNGSSLCWREGFDDWRPIKEVPELAAVLRQRASRPPPPARGAIAPRGAPPARSRPWSPPPRASVASRSADASRPAARSNVVPIGGRLGAAAAPAFEESPEAFDELEGEPTRVSDPLFNPEEHAQPQASRDAPRALGSIPPDPFDAQHIPAVPPAATAPAAPDAFTAAPVSFERVRARRGLPVGAWIAIAGAGAFGMMLAAMVGTKLLREDDASEVAVAEPTGSGETAQPELIVPDEVEESVEEQPTEEGSEEEGSSGTTRPRTGTTKRPAGSTGGTQPTKQLTAEQRRLLERFSGETGAAPGNIAVQDQGESRARAGQVDAAQLTAVVTRNRPALRRCYETAIRGMGDPPTVRVNVTVHVGVSGGVTGVSAVQERQNVGGLSQCIESTVRRWRFPSSGTAAPPIAFPVVFQPGS